MTDSTAVEQRRDQTPAPLLQQIDQVMPQLERLGVDPNRFARVLMSECRKNEDLLACTPASFLGAAFASAQLHLEPGPLGEVWFIPRRNRKERTTEVQWMLGYRGMVELARRAGVIVTVETVHANDHFEVTAGTNPSIVHRPTLDNRGEAIAWYAVARFPDGRTVHRVLNRDDVADRRKQSDAGKKGYGPWVSHFDAMARKSAIRALWSQLPMVPELQEAARIDEQVLTMPSVDGPAVPAIAGSQTTDVPAIGGDPLDTATVNDLRQACGDAGLDKAGSRDELVARLKAARAAAETSGSSTLNEEPETGSPSQKDDQPASTDGLPVPPPPDDPDGDAHVPGPAPASSAEPVEDDTSDPETAMTEAQRRKLFALFSEHDITDAQRKAVIVGHYGLQSMNDLTVGQAVKLIDLLESEDGPAKFRVAADEWLSAGDEAAEQPRETTSSSAGDHGEGSPAEGTTAAETSAEVAPEPDPRGKEAPSGAAPPPTTEPEPDLGAELSARAYERAQAASPIGKLRARINEAWRVMAVADHPAYAESWGRVSAILDGDPRDADWSSASEMELRREAEDLTRAVSVLEADGKVR